MRRPATARPYGAGRDGGSRPLVWFLLVSAVAGPAAAAPPPTAVWAVDPVEAGPNVAARGRSLFDELTVDGVPFPFESLLAQIDRRIGCAQRTCIDGVLIPLGRSLQRMAAAPEFFASPRVVVAVTGEGRGPAFARHRLYIGYQPHAALLEVISYNDEAGRFEFQLVHDYREGTRRRAVAAERTVCVACHQNQAPIFSRPLWSETNANPAVAAALRAAAGPAATSRRHWLGIDLQRGVDSPNAIDDATDAANLLAVTQRVWRDACDAKCRPAAIRAALQYRLSNGRQFEPLGDFVRQFRSAYPQGLAIPNPDLPNRDPLSPPGATGPMQAHVAAAFEALQPRAPLEIWTADDPYLDRRFVLGLASMFAESDVVPLRRRAAAAFARIAAHRWDDDSLSRRGLREAVGLAAAAVCCHGEHRSDPGVAVATADPPRPAREPGAAGAALPVAARDFITACGACHATADRFPPNFLTGDAVRITSQLHHCAPRIYVRLANWQRPRESWTKVPMPPPRAGASGHPFAQTRADPAVAALQRTAGEWLRAEADTAVAPEQLLAQAYEDLRPCLPAAR